MKDRIPTYPGRVRLTPTGQPNLYDMVRADEPIQEGTPINKNSFLTDETAALYGLGEDATPNDALLALINKNTDFVEEVRDALGNYAKVVRGSYTETDIRTTVLTFDAVPSMIFVYDDQASGRFTSLIIFPQDAIGRKISILPSSTSTAHFSVYTENNTVSFSSQFSSGVTVTYYAILTERPLTPIEGENTVTFSIYYPYDNTTDTFIFPSNSTWSDFVNHRKSVINYVPLASAYGVGETTGRVYVYSGANFDDDYRSTYLLHDGTDGENFVLGTETIQPKTYYGNRSGSLEEAPLE